VIRKVIQNYIHQIISTSNHSQRPGFSESVPPDFSRTISALGRHYAAIWPPSLLKARDIMSGAAEAAA
jgi:hypothetical protein